MKLLQLPFILLQLKCRVINAFACPTLVCTQGFRSNAALEALAKASENNVENVVLYNYPSFSGAYSALFAKLFHFHLNSPCLILPFSSVEPLRYIAIFVALCFIYLCVLWRNQDSERAGIKYVFC